MSGNSLQNLVDLFKQGFKELGTNVPPADLERLAISVHRAMSVEARSFHTLEHVFQFVDRQDPVHILAALYHDIVYYHVDKGFSPAIWQVIEPYIILEPGPPPSFRIRSEVAESDQVTWLTLKIFGFQPGQMIGLNNGLNEFLSALTMNLQLANYVGVRERIKMTACVEATIPFRTVDELGRSPFDRLAERLFAINQQYNLGCTEDEIIQAIQLAVAFSNKDIENFAEEDTGRFLSNTWKLLPETNTALRLRNIYTIQDYRRAIGKMEVFMRNLDPQNVLNSFRGYPPEQEMAHKLARVRINMQNGREYLSIKLVTAAILEAIALATGGDAPISMFMGDLPEDGKKVRRLEHFLPQARFANQPPPNPVIHHLLSTGLGEAVNFDLMHSPLSLFVYESVEPEEMPNYLENARRMFNLEWTAEMFIYSTDAEVINPVIIACAEMVQTRRDAILAFLR